MDHHFHLDLGHEWLSDVPSRKNTTAALALMQYVPIVAATEVRVELPRHTEYPPPYTATSQTSRFSSLCTRPPVYSDANHMYDSDGGNAQSRSTARQYLSTSMDTCTTEHTLHSCQDKARPSYHQRGERKTRVQSAGAATTTTLPVVPLDITTTTAVPFNGKHVMHSENGFPHLSRSADPYADAVNVVDPYRCPYPMDNTDAPCYSYCTNAIDFSPSTHRRNTTTATNATVSRIDRLLAGVECPGSDDPRFVLVRDDVSAAAVAPTTIKVVEAMNASPAQWYDRSAFANRMLQSSALVAGGWCNNSNSSSKSNTADYALAPTHMDDITKSHAHVLMMDAPSAPTYSPALVDGRAHEVSLPLTHPHITSSIYPVCRASSNNDYLEKHYTFTSQRSDEQRKENTRAQRLADMFNISCIPQRKCLVDNPDQLRLVCLSILHSAQQTRNRCNDRANRWERDGAGCADDCVNELAFDNEKDESDSTDAVRDMSSLPEDAIVAVDLEGRNLGRDGSICIVTLSTIHCVYVIDIIKIGPDALRPRESLLRMILESCRITKLMFDCRADCDALYHIYNVRMRHVCDLQVAACWTRKFGVRWLPSLMQVLQELDLVSENDAEIKESGREFFDPRKGGSFDNWEKRPLDSSLIEYCFVDVKYFFRARTLLRQHLDVACATAEQRVQYVCSGKYNAQNRENCMYDFDFYRR